MRALPLLDGLRGTAFLCEASKGGLVAEGSGDVRSLADHQIGHLSCKEIKPKLPLFSRMSSVIVQRRIPSCWEGSRVCWELRVCGEGTPNCCHPPSRQGVWVDTPRALPLPQVYVHHHPMYNQGAICISKSPHKALTPRPFVPFLNNMHMPLT